MMMTGFPLAAHADDDFCASLNKIVGDADNSFQNVSKKAASGLSTGTVTVPGFPEFMAPGVTMDEMKSCKVTTAPAPAYACSSMQAMTADIAGDAKKCLKDWTAQENTVGGAKQVTLSNGKTSVMVATTATPPATVLTIMKQPAK
jgi:hypothetical protein